MKYNIEKSTSILNNQFLFFYIDSLWIISSRGDQTSSPCKPPTKCKIIKIKTLPDFFPAAVHRAENY